jgi:16S rRNA (adenine1518-N6/adenine1519-N6)-dimethyltransferase
VVANVPYYITSKIVQMLSEAANPPSVAVLLVQKEVAERLAAKAGDMSILAISAQLYHDVELGPPVPAKYFIPPPKVDSQVVVMRRREQPLFENLDTKEFFRVVKAGFSAKRKKLRSSISGGLAISKPEAEQLLTAAGIDPNSRAEALALDDWYRLAGATLDS